ncbi:MAG: protein kinase [Planctomycetota bacterium]
MNFERWARIEEIYGAALEQPPEDREEFVREACQDDPELAAEVLRLMSEEPPDDFLEAPDASFGQSRAMGLIGRQLGPFKIIRELGRGGMGVVYLAREEGLSRHVALKVLASSILTTDQQIERFHRGARAAAKLKHESIAQVYREGEDDGLHYFAMEYVEGPTLADELLAVATGAKARVHFQE